MWNLGVPGYSSAQELAYLRQIGPQYRPDLVIVGFYENDVLDDNTIRTTSQSSIIFTTIKTAIRKHWYSVDWYRRSFEQVRLRFLASAEERRLSAETDEHEARIFARPAETAMLAEQQLTNPTPLTDDELAVQRCSSPQIEHFSAEVTQRQPGFQAWVDVIRELQRLAATGQYDLMFFINAAPRRCQSDDVFDTRGTAAQNAFLLNILSNGTPAVSSHDAFARYRPSHMPLAGGHSIGNSNAVKANVLFGFLKSRFEDRRKQ